MSDTTVVSLGGSIVVPDGVDTDFLSEFVSRMTKRLRQDAGLKLAIVVGGGSTARSYQEAARMTANDIAPDVLDEIGIAATRVNATVVKAAFGSLCLDPVITDPESVTEITGRVLLMGGWKPGFSTDNVAVHLARSLGADTLLNLSNIKQIYTADPKIDPDARPLTHITWDELKALVGDTWEPGKNTPFDPVATRKAAQLAMTVIAADGRDLDNLDRLLNGQPFLGTTITP